MYIYIYDYIHLHLYLHTCKPFRNEFWMCFIQSLNQRCWTTKQKNKGTHMRTHPKCPRKKIWFPDFEGARPCHAQLWSVTINAGFSTKEGVLAEQAWPTRIHVKLSSQKDFEKFSTTKSPEKKKTKCCISVFVSFLSDHLILGIYEFETRCKNWKGNLSW